MARYVTSLLALLVGLAGPATVNADITVARIFSDHMVLQQNANVSIWGTADPGEAVRVQFEDQKVEATTGADGKWTAVIKTPGAGGPYRMEISAVKGEPKIVLNDVLIGEVWICSGQSNMEWPVSRADFPEREVDGSKEFPTIRLFTVERNSVIEPLNGLSKARGWDVCNPETVKDFSAVAYFFARKLTQELGVPVGLVHTSWGGTRCEAWTSMETLQKVAAFKPLLDHWVESDNLSNQNRPSNLYNGMIAPLKGLVFQGVIWYQGEANVGRGEQYAELFPTMIEDWRQQLDGGREFPFYFVQLASFRYGQRDESALAEVWDAQLKTYRRVPHTGIVVTTDISDVKDIHPRNKQDVGSRLALWALADCYAGLPKTENGSVVIPSGPLYRAKRVVDGKIEVFFDFVGEGLVARDGEPLSDFLICGPDGKFVPAIAEVNGDHVVVWSEEVPEPTEVRFGWTDTAQPNLFNAAGLPASPFRTDDFPLASAGVSF